MTKRAVIATPEAGQAPDLAGSDLRAYDDALIQYACSWEMLDRSLSARSKSESPTPAIT